MLNALIYIGFACYSIISLITIGGWCYATIQEIKENGFSGGSIYK